MTAGIIYYTDSRLKEPLAFQVRSLIADAGLPIVSCSLLPLNFGRNVVLEAPRGYVTMIRQILTALEASETDVVFFTEHDVLYPRDHFDFRPTDAETFYYNVNVWRWWAHGGYAVTWDHLRSVSGLCCARSIALAYYRALVARIDALGIGPFSSPEPKQGRVWGYEPGKPTKRGGIRNDKSDEWRSETPLIDVRHTRTFSPAKVKLTDFKHLPTGWKQEDFVPKWDRRFYA